MFNFLNPKKVKCENCGGKHRKCKMVNFAGMDFCSESCFVNFFKDITTDELLALDEMDKQINPGYHIWVNNLRLQYKNK